MKLTREFWTPKTYTAKIVCKKTGAIAYLLDRADGKPVAMCFLPKSVKPFIHYRYQSAKHRAKHVAEFFANAVAHQESVAANRAQSKAFRHTLKIGDLLHNSWGYDQTNVEFFQVVALVGSTMVEARPIAQQTEETGWLCGQCVPVPDHFCGKAKRYRVLEGNVLDIHKAHFGRAHVYERKEVAPGVMVGDSVRWSSYA